MILPTLPHKRCQVNSTRSFWTFCWWELRHDLIERRGVARYWRTRGL